MIPSIPELDQLEQLASSQEPSLEGSWAHTVQLVDHLYNSFCKRDPINNEVLYELWTTMFELINELELQTANRPIPFDTVHQLFSYSSKAIEKIIQNPSKKMMKETAMVSPNRLKSPRTKTMNWMAKQPGRNIREKLAGKNRVLTEQNVYSIQTKENAVFMKVIKNFMIEFRNRLEYGINTELFDLQQRDNELFDEIDNFLKFATKLKHQELGDVQIVPVTQPNNILIGDKNYSIIWRTYQLLNTRKNNLEVSWNYAIERYVFLTFIQLVSRLGQYEQLILEDGLGKIQDTQGFMGINQYEESSKTSFRFFRKPIEKGSIIMVNREQGYGFIKTKQHSKIYFHKSLLGEETFGKLKSKDVVYVEAQKTNKGINAIICAVRPISYSIVVVYNKSTIELRLEQWERTIDTANYSLTNCETWYYNFEQLNATLEVNRGVPITISGHASTSKVPMYKVKSFADMRYINEFIDQLIVKLKKKYQLQLREVVTTEEQLSVRNAGIDFTRIVPMMLVNNESWDKTHYKMLQFTRGIETMLASPNESHLYSLNQKVYNLYNAFNPKTTDYGMVMQSYSMLIAQLRQKLPLELQTPFIYLVPDNIDEFAQKDIKKALTVQYPTSFPIWRSVAGALAVENDILAAHANTILVIDTHGNEASAIKLIRKKHGNKSYFQHYPPFEAPRKSKEVTLESYCFEYLRLYATKYKVTFTSEQIEHLLQSGIAEKLLLAKQDTFIVADHGASPIELVYDEELVKQVEKKWFTSFSTYIYQLQEVLREEKVSKIDYIVVLGDHLFDKQPLKTLFKERFKATYCATVQTKQALTAIVNDEVNEKLAQSKPLWFEYLPDLSLEVVKNGHYSKLQLIKDEAIGNTMGMGKVFEVHEHLMLPKGQKTYRFPLIREGSTNTELDAIIRDVSFPLRSDTEVKLSIEYKYGYENSYRLFIQTINTNAPFKKVEAEWVEELEPEMQTKSHLDIPPSFMHEADLEREVEKLSAFIQSTEKVITRQLPRDFADQQTIQRAHRIFHSTIYHLRRIVVQNNELAEAFINDFYSSDLYVYCLEIDNYIADHLYEDYARDIQLFKTDIWRYLCSFGEHIHENVWDYVMKNLNKFDDKVGIALLYQNSDNEQLLAFLKKKVEKNPQQIIRSLRDTLWRDTDLLLNIYRYNPKIIEVMYQEIYTWINRVYRNQGALKPKVFRDYCEVLLAILALRDKPEFKRLKTGSTTMRKLAKYVRSIDARCYEIDSKPLHSYLQFNLQKPEDLWKMSDLAFVVNAYLTGELMDNLISVREISIE
ncbi:cold-shock protein [Ectobacillus funiculus]|uniref:cold-shock protein n=1 Tax=Ectobacillus funiculus TaxID=137993 RepID=UPI00101E08FF|nr:DUF2357 domain-containing protein [Ectobacillus funiculus]